MSTDSPKVQAEKLFRSAKRLVLQDRYDTAILVLDQATQHSPTAQLYDYRGVILSLTLQSDVALESFAMALSLATTDAERAEIYFHRGLLYGQDQLYEQAFLDLTRACRLNHFKLAYREALDQLKKGVFQ